MVFIDLKWCCVGLENPLILILTITLTRCLSHPLDFHISISPQAFGGVINLKFIKTRTLLFVKHFANCGLGVQASRSCRWITKAQVPTSSSPYEGRWLIFLIVFVLWGIFPQRNSEESGCSSNRVTLVIKNPNSKRNINFRAILTCWHSRFQWADGVLKAFLSFALVSWNKLPSQNTSWLYAYRLYLFFLVSDPHFFYFPFDPSRLAAKNFNLNNWSRFIC